MTLLTAARPNRKKVDLLRRIRRRIVLPIREVYLSYAIKTRRKSIPIYAYYVIVDLSLIYPVVAGDNATNGDSTNIIPKTTV
ncbi:MAG TPA: hypothetical protein VH500_05565 [Nitrososphaeraceae archaeon]